MNGEVRVMIDRCRRRFAERLGNRNERGATMIIAAICLVPLLVMTALVVDIGQKKQLEASAQSAIDAAALAATYNVRYVKAGDLDHATQVAKDKVSQGFDIDPSLWDTCNDPSRLETLPPGHAGKCISFEQRPDATGNLVWFVKIKLPEFRFSTFFAGAFGENVLSVQSVGGADGGIGDAPPTSAQTTTTRSPEQVCMDAIGDASTDQVVLDVKKQIDDYMAAHPGEQIVFTWWDGTSVPNPMPIGSIPTFVKPSECGPTTQLMIDWWVHEYWYNWEWYWYNDCLWRYLPAVNNDWNLLSAGICQTPSLRPKGYIPPAATTTTNSATTSTTTTSKPILPG